MNMTGATSNYTTSAFPVAFLTTESYGLIWRLLKRGPVDIEIDLKNSFSNRPVEVYNTVAEIPGTEKPDEVVIIGGHIDSWDLGTGATDDGTGIMAVLEAARALKAVGVRPTRTIRFVMFRARSRVSTVRELTSKRTSENWPGSPRSWFTTWARGTSRALAFWDAMISARSWTRSSSPSRTRSSSMS